MRGEGALVPRASPCLCVCATTCVCHGTPPGPLPLMFSPCRAGGSLRHGGSCGGGGDRAGMSQVSGHHLLPPSAPLLPWTLEPNALLELVKWNQISCSTGLVPFNQL